MRRAVSAILSATAAGTARGRQMGGNVQIILCYIFTERVNSPHALTREVRRGRLEGHKGEIREPFGRGTVLQTDALPGDERHCETMDIVVGNRHVDQREAKQQSADVGLRHRTR